ATLNRLLTLEKVGPSRSGLFFFPDLPPFPHLEAVTFEQQNVVQCRCLFLWCNFRGESKLRSEKPERGQYKCANYCSLQLQRRPSPALPTPGTAVLTSGLRVASFRPRTRTSTVALRSIARR